MLQGGDMLYAMATQLSRTTPCAVTLPGCTTRTTCAENRGSPAFGCLSDSSLPATVHFAHPWVNTHIVTLVWFPSTPTVMSIPRATTATCVPRPTRSTCAWIRRPAATVLAHPDIIPEEVIGDLVGGRGENRNLAVCVVTKTQGTAAATSDERLVVFCGAFCHPPATALAAKAFW